jgi:hypothetical protein
VDDVAGLFNQLLLEPRGDSIVGSEARDAKKVFVRETLPEKLPLVDSLQKLRKADLENRGKLYQCADANIFLPTLNRAHE